MNKSIFPVTSLLATLILFGCGSTDVIVEQEPVFDISALVDKSLLTDDEINRLTHHYFFKFDSEFLDINAYHVISSHAKFIAADPSIKVLVEGHADDTGEEDYNRKLGYKRAKAVANILALNGVKDEQMIIRSYSTDKPLSRVTDQLNRRATIIY